MFPQGVLRMDSIDSTSKKSNRVFYILGFIEFIFISICLLLLLLNQYLSSIVDDYSPAYKTPDDGDRTTPFSTTFYPTTISTTNSPTTNPTTTNSSTTTTSTFHKVFNPKSHTTKIPPAGHPKEEETVKMPIPKKNPTIYATTLLPTTNIRITRGSGTARILNNYSKANNSDLNINEDSYKRRIIQKTKGSYLKTHEPMLELGMESLTDGPKTATTLKPQPKEDWIKVFISNLVPGSPSFKIKRERNFTEKKQEHHKMRTKLSNLLIIYPCCIAAIIILCMQLISRLTNDIIFKSTMVLFVATSIVLGITIFAVSVAESMNYGNSITILIAVSSAIFLLLQVIDFILLFTAM